MTVSEKFFVVSLVAATVIALGTVAVAGGWSLTSLTLLFV